MAGSSLLSLIDDIATLLDDVSVLTKVATKKTAGVLGDDLALNAEQVAGVDPSRELPVVWGVAKGSVVNKLILVPSALLLSFFLPVAIQPLLMLGGAFLCFEGFEKVAHKLFHRGEEQAERVARERALTDATIDPVVFEREKVKAAIRTDFVLSAEIIVISLGTLEAQPLTRQIGALVAVAALMTVGVYGLVAAIVKLDDAGLALSRSGSAVARALGRAILAGAPWLMKGLGVAGTVAMFLVGGQILAHGWAPLHHWVEELAHYPLGWLTPLLANAAVGVTAGALLVAAWTLAQRVLKRSGAGAAPER